MSIGGVLGFTIKAPPVETGGFKVPVINATRSDEGGPWTLTLSAWAGPPPVAVNNVKAVITWGGGGFTGAGSDTATIDYPAAGQVVTVHGTTVRVELVGATNPATSDVPPLWSGWVTPAASPAQRQGATLTTFPELDGTSVLPVPARARAFRLMPFTGIDTAVTLTQLSGNATPRQVAADFLAGTTAPVDLPDNRWSWFPLHPDAASLVVQPTGEISYAVQWLLELG